MDDNVRDFPTPPKETPVKDFLRKPMHETTIGDTLILHASTAVISVVIGVSIQGWIALLQRGKTK